MKKFLIFIIFTVALFYSFTTVFANSGPVFWKGYPSSDVMSIKKDSPIVVESESLVFDFSGEDKYHYTVGGRVTATYEMLNSMNEEQIVQMAFPFVGRIDNYMPEDVAVTADDSVLPYDLYIGDVVDSFGNPRQEDKEVNYDFANIVDTLTDDPYTAKHFIENEKGKLYFINVEPTTDQRINFAVDFTFDHEKTKVLTYGFNRYERDGIKTRIAAWCYEPVTLKIYVLGEDIDFEINAYTDGELKAKTELFTYRISAQEMEVRQYLMEYIKNNASIKSIDVLSDNQIYNLYAKSLDECFEQSLGFASEYDLMSQGNFERILTLVYTVEFPRNSSKEICVSYNTTGTMDKTKTSKPMYSFDYILNPAKNWSDFKNLNIKIVAPQVAPYILKSNIKFLNEGNRVYSAALPNLPEGDLTFTLYGDEKVTFVDKARGALQGSFGNFTSLVILFIIIIAIGAIIIVIRKGKMRNGNEKG